MSKEKSVDSTDQLFIRRCFDLAQLGAGQVAPNPMVGAVIVHNNRIIGEGYHAFYGGPHAEVNAVANVLPSDLHLLKQATIYVSLEPCNIFGKTPPCTDLILKHNIPRIVVSWLDFTPEVSGNGVRILRNEGREVKTNILTEQGFQVSKFRNTFVRKQRPYLILKYAQSQDGFMASANNEQLWFTNAFSKRLVHKWRSEVDAILIGSRTARIDNPQLNNRLYFGSSPIRIVLNRKDDLPDDLHVFSESISRKGEKIKTVLVTDHKSTKKNVLNWVIPSKEDDFLQMLMAKCYENNWSSMIVEGGAQILQMFLEKNYWDEARVFTGKSYIRDGIPAPKIPKTPDKRYQIIDDQLEIFYNQKLSYSQ